MGLQEKKSTQEHTFLLQSIKNLKCKGIHQSSSVSKKKIHQSSKQQPDQNKTVLPIGIYEAQNLYTRNRNIDHDLIDVYSPTSDSRLKEGL